MNVQNMDNLAIELSHPQKYLDRYPYYYCVDIKHLS